MSPRRSPPPVAASDIDELVRKTAAAEVERILGPYALLLSKLAATANIDVSPTRLKPYSAARNDFDPVTGISIADLPSRLSLAEVMNRVERQVVERSIRMHGGNREHAARKLKLARSSLFLRLQKWREQP